jgi:hypothetical protein
MATQPSTDETPSAHGIKIETVDLLDLGDRPHRGGPEHPPRVRRAVTVWLIGLFGFQILAALGFAFIPWSQPDMKEHLDTLKDVLTITFGPTVTLLGSAIGFYFGREGRD